MALPKISTPTFSLKIPSINEEKRFRPFLVKEEKILLLAQQGDEKDIVYAIKQIINNCAIDTIDIDSLAIFDIEYIFLQLRSKSVNGVVNLKYRDTEDDEIYEFQVNLDDVNVVFDPEHTNKVSINEDVGIILKYPSFDAIKDIIVNQIEGSMVFDKIINQCIDKVYDSVNVHTNSDFTEKELTEFIESLDYKTFKQIERFFQTMPKIYYEIKYKNKFEHDRIIKLETIKDFFTWR
jgi:hypothetical protein